MSEQRVECFRRLMAAQERIAEALKPYGVTQQQLQQALDAAEASLPADDADESDFYRPALSRYVAALGGHLDTDAVFAEVTVRLDP